MGLKYDVIMIKTETPEQLLEWLLDTLRRAKDMTAIIRTYKSEMTRYLKMDLQEAIRYASTDETHIQAVQPYYNFIAQYNTIHLYQDKIADSWVYGFVTSSDTASFKEQDIRSAAICLHINKIFPHVVWAKYHHGGDDASITIFNNRDVVRAKTNEEGIVKTKKATDYDTNAIIDVPSCVTELHNKLLQKKPVEYIADYMLQIP